MNPNQMHLQPPISNTPSVFAPVPQRQPHLQQYQQHPDTQPQSYAVSPSAPGTGQVARKTIAQFTQQPAKKVGHSTADYKARFLKAKSKYERANAVSIDRLVSAKVSQSQISSVSYRRGLCHRSFIFCSSNDSSTFSSLTDHRGSSCRNQKGNRKARSIAG